MGDIGGELLAHVRDGVLLPVLGIDALEQGLQFLVGIVGERLVEPQLIDRLHDAP